MCLICKPSTRLFRVYNPCCCCSLRAGTALLCTFSVLTGAASAFLPSSLQIPFDNYSPSIDEGFAGEELKWQENPNLRFAMHYGTLFAQAISGTVLLTAIALKLGGLINFVAGTLWMICRIMITSLQIPLLERLYEITSRDFEVNNEEYHQWQRYLFVTGGQMALHIYFFLAVRYYTMENWDIWRYRPSLPSYIDTPRRRHNPYVLVEGKRAFDRRHKPEDEMISEWRQRRLKYRSVRPEDREWEAWNLERDIPMWRKSKEFKIKGEDYSAMDPVRHIRNWERLVQSGALKLTANEIYDDAKIMQVQEAITARGHKPDVTIVDSDVSVGPKDGPFLAGFVSGKIKVRLSRFKGAGHGYRASLVDLSGSGTKPSRKKKKRPHKAVPLRSPKLPTVTTISEKEHKKKKKKPSSKSDPKK